MRNYIDQKLNKYEKRVKEFFSSKKGNNKILEDNNSSTVSARSLLKNLKNSADTETLRLNVQTLLSKLRFSNGKIKEIKNS